METSIEVEMSALNVFAAQPFQRSTNYDAWVLRYDNKYKIKKGMPNECCIVRSQNLPD